MNSQDRKPFYLQQVLREIKQTRESQHGWDADAHAARAQGQIIAGLNLGVLDEEEFDRLWDLASNAGRYRRAELQDGLPLHTRKPVPASTQEAAA